jgi:hypothetical protein
LAQMLKLTETQVSRKIGTEIEIVDLF